MTMPTTMIQMARIGGSIAHRWVVLPLMVMDCMIWLAMFMNGVPTGMALITLVNRQLRTHQGQVQAHDGCCGVVLGVALLASYGYLTASTPLRLVGTATVGFGVCQD